MENVYDLALPKCGMLNQYLLDDIQMHEEPVNEEVERE